MIGGKRCADRAAGIACGRLNPDVVEVTIAQHLAVGDAIQRDAAGKAQVPRAGLLREAARQPQHGFIQYRLDRGSDIHVERRQQLIGRAHRLAEQLGKAFVGHGEAGAIIEIGEIEAERAVRLQIDQVVEDELCVFRLAIGREPHHLVFAGVDLEAGVIGRGRIQEAQRMREMDLLENLELAAVAGRGRCRGPLADAVHGEYGRILERRGIEGRGRVAQMVLAEQQLGAVELRRKLLQFVREQALLEQLFLQPQRDRHLERAEAARRQRDIGLQQPLEFEERLVVEHDVVERVHRGARLRKTRRDGVVREGRVVLLAGEALLLRGGDDAAVLDQRRGAVVIEGGNPEDAHRLRIRLIRTACR